MNIAFPFKKRYFPRNIQALTGSTRPPLGVNALPQYYHMASFNYGGMKARDVGRIVDVIRAILCRLVSPMIIER